MKVISPELLIGIYFMIVIVWTLYIHHYSLSTGISSSIFSSLLLTQQHNDDYELAKLESYGFFTDIDSVTWHRHQQHAHSAIYDETIYYNRSYPNDQADTKHIGQLREHEINHRAFPLG